MIWNVIDRRIREYRWAKINAVVEDVAHDNSCADSDERRGVSLHEAVHWAESQPGRVTLYLYNEDEGI